MFDEHNSRMPDYHEYDDSPDYHPPTDDHSDDEGDELSEVE